MSVKPAVCVVDDDEAVRNSLKLLFRSSGKYFLRPSDPGFRVNILIPDGQDIRVELFGS